MMPYVCAGWPASRHIARILLSCASIVLFSSIGSAQTDKEMEKIIEGAKKQKAAKKYSFKLGALGVLARGNSETST